MKGGGIKRVKKATKVKRKTQTCFLGEKCEKLPLRAWDKKGIIKRSYG